MPQSAPINATLQQAFVQLIAGGTGWQIKPKDRTILEQKIQHRMAVLSITQPESYHQLLLAQTSESRQEWQNLIALLSNPESFFFRDRGQFSVLRQSILPDLIQRHQHDKQLRILSAGCSTGEEPYSLALLLKDLIPELDQWRLTILGTDVNTHALKHAKAGIYSPWSLRGVDAVTKQQFFRLIDGKYHLDEDIRQMVRFRALNLAGKTLSQPNAQFKIDLIVCRNVFIYFRKAAIATVIDGFYQMLRPSGYLITGHTELWNQDMSQFETQSYPETLVYQRPLRFPPGPSARPSSPRPSSPRPPSTGPSSTSPPFPDPPSADIPDAPVSLTSRLSPPPVAEPPASPREQTLLDTAVTLFKSQAFDQAIPYVEKSLKRQPQNFNVLCLMAQLQFKTGQFETAKQYCRQATEIEVFSVRPYYILTQVLIHQGDLAAAKRTLKKILYLEPTSVAAYIELSRLYQQEGNAQKSRKMRRLALKLLRGLPAGTQILELDNLTVAELLLKF
ncbi:MAG: CheR family methyltransferase [Cyanobacteria bacterium P01_A01_bin.114]